MAVFKNGIFAYDNGKPVTPQSLGISLSGIQTCQQFFSSGSITDSTQKYAIYALVGDLETYGIWDKMKAVYPFVGQPGVSSSFEFNLKDTTTFRGTFYGGWTFASTGVTPNGTSAYMDTGLNSSITLSQNSKHISSYVRTNVNNTLLGCGESSTFDQLVFTSGNLYGNLSSNFAFVSHTPTKGLYLTRRINSTTSNTFANNVLIQTDSQTSNGNPNKNIYIGARNYTSIDFFSNSETAFASIGDGLTDTEAANFYTAVQRFQTTLGRQV